MFLRFCVCLLVFFCAAKLAFVVLRQQASSLQAVAALGDSVPKAMIKFITSVPSVGNGFVAKCHVVARVQESIVDVVGSLVAPEAGQVESAT